MPQSDPASYDAIVVGGGGSGLAAGCSIAEHGGRAIVLEKQPALGGTTAIAVGSFTAAGTRQQHAAGIDDRAEDHIEDVANFAAQEIECRNNEPLRQHFLRESAATLDWLESLGLAFYGPSPEPPNRVARMHNVIPAGRAYVAALEQAARRAGVEIRCGAAVEALLRDGDRVTGVRASIDGMSRAIYARRGVVLAAGDYAANGRMIAEAKGPQYEAIEGINPHATGDGHRLAADAGARLVNMDITYGPELRFVAPRSSGRSAWLPLGPRLARLAAAGAGMLPKVVMRRFVRRLLVSWQHPEAALFNDGAILINRAGKRFVDERRYPDRELAVARQPGKDAYILLDGRLAGRYSAWPHFISTAPDIAYAYVRDYRRLRPDVTRTATTLAVLAGKAGIAADSLQDTVDAFNRSVAGQEADAWGRTGDQRPLAGPPWILLGPAKAYFTTTEGGAAVNTSLQVLDPAGDPISGLYAVGQNGLGGMVLWGHGLHIAWALTSGRLVGRRLMQSS